MTTPQVRFAMLATATLNKQPRNPNEMTPQEYDNLRAAIRTLGFLDPLLVAPAPDGTHDILDGHHRLAAALDEGIDPLPCVVTTTRAKDVVDAIQLSMNRNRGRVRLDIAEQILRELSDEGWSVEEMQATGYAPDEIEALLKDAHAPDEKPKGKPQSLGDMLGEGGADRPWSLELRFSTQAELTEVKRALKKASGKSKDESLGVLHLLKMKDEESDAAQ